MSEDATPDQADQTPNTPATPASITSLDQIPQALRDRLEAEHKRGLQKQIVDLQTQNSKLSGLRDQSSQLLELMSNHVELDPDSDIGTIATTITGTLDGLKSESERLEAANKKKDGELTAAQAAAQALQNELFGTLTQNQLQAQLGVNEEGKARTVSPKAAEMIANELARVATVGEDRTVSFEMEILDAESGTKVKKAVDAKTAVATLEADQAWSAFFTATVNSGAGGDVVDNVQRNSSGDVDINSLMADPAKYMEIMEKNPAIIDAMLAKMGN